MAEELTAEELGGLQELTAEQIAAMDEAEEADQGCGCEGRYASPCACPGQW